MGAAPTVDRARMRSRRWDAVIAGAADPAGF
jgi:hypothetical protein